MRYQKGVLTYKPVIEEFVISAMSKMIDELLGTLKRWVSDKKRPSAICGVTARAHIEIESICESQVRLQSGSYNEIRTKDWSYRGNPRDLLSSSVPVTKSVPADEQHTCQGVRGISGKGM